MDALKHLIEVWTGYAQGLTGSIGALAFVCAFIRMGSIFVAFITSPLTFSFPAMNNRCAFAFPATSLPKSSSDNDRMTV